MSVFERYPKLTLGFIVLALGCATVLCLEWGARKFGLGDVVVYHSSPVYGYRPNPNQVVTRMGQSQVAINNLGLRASSDWDAKLRTDRVLFVGDSVTYGGSYIDNQDLFSEVATRGTSLIPGNAGVNGWGVLNMHALIKESKFLPAQTYVTLMPEGDFYRGLNRLGGQPYWTKPTKWALEELFFYGLYRVSLSKMPGLGSVFAEDEQDLVVDIAARHLKEMDDFLKSQGFDHIIVISPARSQALGTQPIDGRVKKYLNQYQLNAHYFLDNLQDDSLDIPSLYYDEIHLSKEGHKLWGEWLQALLTE